MSYCEENKFQPKLLCNKGDMLLYEITNYDFNKKSYNLQFTISNIDNTKTNIDNLTGFEIYKLLETQNNELIEKIVVTNLTENEADICILITHIAKEIGIKQKYILLNPFGNTYLINIKSQLIIYYFIQLIIR